MLKLYNTRTKNVETFSSQKGKQVGLYTCGPTVYNYAHVGNLRAYVFEDILRRALQQNGYAVQHVMNITDVGHLTDDADQGEDKMEKGAAREGKTAHEIAQLYTDAFQHDIRALNILEPHIWCKATDHIYEQVALVQTLIDKGFTYQTSDGIYFDTTKDVNYGDLANLKAQELEAGARVDMGEKKNPHDFALWKFSPEGSQRQMEWDAFGEKGFPGWHIECSAMASKYLGEQFDIHCGGIDHIPVHHTNEIAQSEAAYGTKPWVNFWLHGAWLVVDEGKMAKSDGNFITLSTLEDRGIDPLAYRFFLLQSHYRRELTFSWDALEAAQKGFSRLKRQVADIDPHTVGDPKLAHEFEAAIADDLNTPEALAVLFTGLKDGVVTKDMVVAFDKYLGLRLTERAPEVVIPANVQELVDARARAREEKDWEKSDALRDEIASHGFTVEDTDDGQTLRKA